MSSELWIQKEHPSCSLQAGWSQRCTFFGSKRYFSHLGGETSWKKIFKLAWADLLTKLQRNIKE